MTLKTILKLCLAALVIIGIFFGYQWATFARQPLPEAVEALQSDALVTVTTTPWLTFTPGQAAPDTGLIFYPGGRIDPRGYSNLMRIISEKGYLVVVPTMPINMAVFNSNIAEKIIAVHPEITHWVIGGHSVGGTAAVQYTSANPEKIDGVAIWSSYPADSADISSLGIPVILMYGGNETRVTDESVGARKHLLPPDTRYIKIEGGDHHQFGSYELTTEEDLATISRQDQHDQILSAMLDMLQSVTEER